MITKSTKFKKEIRYSICSAVPDDERRQEEEFNLHYMYILLYKGKKIMKQKKKDDKPGRRSYLCILRDREDEVGGGGVYWVGNLYLCKVMGSPFLYQNYDF